MIFSENRCTLFGIMLWWILRNRHRVTAIRKSLPFEGLPIFVADARQHPGKYTAGHAGNGSNAAPRLPFSSCGRQASTTAAGALPRSAPAMNDLARQPDRCMCDSAPTVCRRPGQQHQGARRRTDQTLDALKDVPTSAQAE